MNLSTGKPVNGAKVEFEFTEDDIKDPQKVFEALKLGWAGIMSQYKRGRKYADKP